MEKSLLHDVDGLVSPLNHGAVLPLVLLHAGVSLGELGLQIFGTGMRRSDLAPWGVGLDHEAIERDLSDDVVQVLAAPLVLKCTRTVCAATNQPAHCAC